MIGYTTEIDIKNRQVVTIFGNERNTFAFDEAKFPLLEALKVSAEHFHNQLCTFLKSAVEAVEEKDNGKA